MSWIEVTLTHQASSVFWKVLMNVNLEEIQRPVLPSKNIFYYCIDRWNKNKLNETQLIAYIDAKARHIDFISCSPFLLYYDW